MDGLITLDDKTRALLPRFQKLGAPAPQIFTSPERGYRQRAEFRFWHEGDEGWFAMFDPAQRKTPVRTDQLPIAAPLVNRLMPAVRQAVLSEPELGHRLFQVEFLTTLSGEALVTLVYHRPLNQDWALQARQISERLGIHIIGRSRKQKIVLTQDFVTEQLELDERSLRYRQPENCFTQPNGHINIAMLNWARNQLHQPHRDLLELYCGNGNFSLALADRFRQVVATEVSRPAIAAARWNAAENGIENVRFAAMSAEVFTESWVNNIPRRRFADAGIELSTNDFATLLVDPPRAGLDDESCQFAGRFDEVLYISCNPETLLRDLEALTQTHRIAQLAFFDQFPGTGHLETGVLLRIH